MSLLSHPKPLKTAIKDYTKNVYDMAIIETQMCLVVIEELNLSQALVSAAEDISQIL